MRKENGKYICDTPELNNDLQGSNALFINIFHKISVNSEPALKELCETWPDDPLTVDLKLFEQTQDWSHEIDIIKVGPGVKSLYISNSFIHRLDLSEATNLVELTLHNDRALRELTGIDENTTLQTVDLVGNPFRFDPDRIIANNHNLECLKLDILDIPHYPGLLERMVDGGEYGSKYFIQEAVNDTDVMPYSRDEVREAASYMQNRLAEITASDMNMEERRMAILMDAMDLPVVEEEYGGTEAEFVEIYEETRLRYPSNDTKALSEAREIHRRRSMQHTLLGTVMNTGVVCSGRSHYAKYLCEMLGIEAAVVTARTDTAIRQNKTVEYLGADSSQYGLTPDHELIRTKNIDGKWQYTDVTNDYVKPETNDEKFMYLTNLSLLDYCCIDDAHGNITKNKVIPVEKEFEHDSESMTGTRKKELVRSIDRKMGRERDLDHETSGAAERRLLAAILGGESDIDVDDE